MNGPKLHKRNGVAAWPIVGWGVTILLVVFSLALVLLYSQHPVIGNGDKSTPTGSSTLSEKMQQGTSPAVSINYPPASISSSNVSVQQRAREKFITTKKCYSASLAVGVAEHLAQVCAQSDLSNNARLAQRCAQFKKDYPSGNARLTDMVSETCPNGDQAILANYHDSLYAAAVAGDVDAQYCFMDRSPELVAQGEKTLSPEQIKQLIEQSENWAQDAFQRGDWRIVNYMQAKLYSHGANTTYLISALPGLDAAANDPAFARYALLALLRKGAVDEYAADVDQRLSAITVHNPSILPEDVLRSGVLNSADEASAIAWANEMFERYFQHSPQLSAPPVACSYPELNRMLAN